MLFLAHTPREKKKHLKLIFLMRFLLITLLLIVFYLRFLFILSPTDYQLKENCKFMSQPNKENFLF